MFIYNFIIFQKKFSANEILLSSKKLNKSNGNQADEGNSSSDNDIVDENLSPDINRIKPCRSTNYDSNNYHNYSSNALNDNRDSNNDSRISYLNTNQNNSIYYTNSNVEFGLASPQKNHKCQSKTDIQENADFSIKFVSGNNESTAKETPQVSSNKPFDRDKQLSCKINTNSESNANNSYYFKNHPKQKEEEKAQYITERSNLSKTGCNLENQYISASSYNSRKDCMQEKYICKISRLAGWLVFLNKKTN